MCRLSHLFLATTSFIICEGNFSMHPMRMKDVSNLHHGLVASASTGRFSVLCGLGPSLPSWHVSVLHSICPSLCLTLWGHWCSRACFYFSIFLLKLRKKLTHEGEPGGSRCWITVFILLLTGGGGKNAYPLEKMLNLRMKRAFCFGQK